jgi:hypothetical protein
MDSCEASKAGPVTGDAAPCESPMNDTNRLTSLPRELLDSIVEFVHFSSPDRFNDHELDGSSDWELVDLGDEELAESSNANLNNLDDEQREDVTEAGLLNMSLVCKKLREVCLPRFFRRLKINCDKDGFKKLADVSSGNLSPLVREFMYCVPHLFDPRTSNPEHRLPVIRLLT